MGVGGRAEGEADFTEQRAQPRTQTQNLGIMQADEQAHRGGQRTASVRTAAAHRCMHEPGETMTALAPPLSVLLMHGACACTRGHPHRARACGVGGGSGGEGKTDWGRREAL